MHCKKALSSRGCLNQRSQHDHAALRLSPRPDWKHLDGRDDMLSHGWYLLSVVSRMIGSKGVHVLISRRVTMLPTWQKDLAHVIKTLESGRLPGLCGLAWGHHKGLRKGRRRQEGKIRGLGGEKAQPAIAGCEDGGRSHWPRKAGASQSWKRQEIAFSLEPPAGTQPWF